MTIPTDPRRTRALALLAALCAMAASVLAGHASDAQAAKRPQPPKQAVFKASLSGSQVTTWEYHHDRDESDPCDQQIDGYGDQTIRFDAKKQFRIRFVRPSKAQPNAFLTQGRPIVAIENPRLLVSATADRNGEIHYGGIDQVRCQGDNGGGVEPTDETPDCGERTGRFGINLFFHPNGGLDPDELLLPSGYPDKDHLKLSSTGDILWVDPSDGSGTSHLGNTYHRCPMDIGAYIPEAGQLYTSAQRIAERKLFQKSRKRLVISGSTRATHSNGERTGNTILAWNLRLTRVAK